MQNNIDDVIRWKRGNGTALNEMNLAIVDKMYTVGLRCPKQECDEQDRSVNKSPLYILTKEQNIFLSFIQFYVVLCAQPTKYHTRDVLVCSSTNNQHYGCRSRCWFWF